MHDLIQKKLEERKSPIDIIVTGLGFMGFGFLSSIRNVPGLRVPLILTRTPDRAKQFLDAEGLPSEIEHNPSRIHDLANRGILSLSDDLSLIQSYESEVVLEVTGTVAYGADVSMRTLNAKKHLVTMNPELQVTVGAALKKLADQKHVVFTDVVGDQPGSLSQMIAHARLMGFRVLMAGNMKRFLNRYATQKEMQPWATDKGLAVRQTVSFTDGTKQSIEMTLVSNYFGMNILTPGMQGPQAETVQEALTSFPWDNVPKEGVVDYLLGKSLFPGVFLVVEHVDPHQQKYLRYLGLGDGPRYVLFDPYHLCHLEVGGTIAKAVLFSQETIHNTTNPTMSTVTLAKKDLARGTVLEGIGGDTVYGTIDRISTDETRLPVGLSEGAILTRPVRKDEAIHTSDVTVKSTPATILAGLATEK